MSNLENIKPITSRNFYEYKKLLFANLDQFVDSVDSDDFLNFTYLELIFICKYFRSEFYDFLAESMEYFWLENMKYLGRKEQVGLFGLTEDKLIFLEKLVKSEREKK